MGGGKKAQDTKDILFKRCMGVKPDTFHKILSILQKEFNALYKNGGQPPQIETRRQAVHYPKILTAVPYDGQHCGRIRRL
jgi:hypothetical protein